MLTRNPPVLPPSPPSTNTKIERVTEAIEDLTIAVCSARCEPTAKGAFANVTHAREEVKVALREFLQPTLRVVGGSDTPTRKDVVDFTNDPFRFGPPKKQ